MSGCQRLETWGRRVWGEGVQERGGCSYKRATWDLPGSPVADSSLSIQGAWVQSLVRELDPTYHN